jgi:hypothetical protein
VTRCTCQQTAVHSLGACHTGVGADAWHYICTTMYITRWFHAAHMGHGGEAAPKLATPPSTGSTASCSWLVGLAGMAPWPASLPHPLHQRPHSRYTEVKHTS